MDVFQLHRTFPQGSNYWGTNLSQVEMTFMWIIKKKNQQKIMENFRCIFMKYASETFSVMLEVKRIQIQKYFLLPLSILRMPLQISLCYVEY